MSAVLVLANPCEQVALLMTPPSCADQPAVPLKNMLRMRGPHADTTSNTHRAAAVGPMPADRSQARSRPGQACSNDCCWGTGQQWLAHLS